MRSRVSGSDLIAWRIGTQLVQVLAQHFPDAWARVAHLPITPTRLVWLARGLAVWADAVVPLAFWIQESDGIGAWSWSGQDLWSRIQAGDGLDADEALAIMCDNAQELTCPTPQFSGLGVQLYLSGEADAPPEPLMLLIWHLLRSTDLGVGDPLEILTPGDAEEVGWTADRVRRMLRAVAPLPATIDIHATLERVTVLQDGAPLAELIRYAVGDTENPLCRISDGELIEVYQGQHDFGWDDWPVLVTWAADARRVLTAWECLMQRLQRAPMATARRLRAQIMAVAVDRPAGGTPLVQVLASSAWASDEMEEGADDDDAA